MKTYKNLYQKICSRENLMLAYEKARKGKSKKDSVIGFEKDLHNNLEKLRQELLSCAYKPRSLHRFIVRDPKTRTIHSSAFRDRVVHHALINIIGPIFEKRFIYDSYANQIGKGTHPAIKRFDIFKRKVSHNGQTVKTGGGANDTKNNFVQGYCLKADVKQYFDTVDHEVILSILKKKIADEKVIWLVKQILDNFECEVPGKGMPLGNYTSQFTENENFLCPKIA